MRWETLKRRVAAYVDALPADEFNQIRANAGQRPVAEYVGSLDVRLVAGLREHARPAFPKALRHGPLVADINDRGHWVVERKT